MIVEFIAPFFYKLLYMSVTALVVGTIVMLVRRFADKRFSPFWKYAMWGLVLAALLIPWRPQSNFAVMNNTERLQDVSFRNAYIEAQTDYQQAAIQEAGDNEPSERLMEAKAKVDALHWQTILFDQAIPAAWLCGLVLFGLYMILGSLRLKSKIRKSMFSIDTDKYDVLLECCKHKFGVTRKVSLAFQTTVKTPALLGVIKPIILLPDYAEFISAAHLEYIILHELSHLKRRDHIANALLLALQSIYWFNPLTWFLFKFIREDMELANDAAVLHGMGKDEQREYSLSLLDVLAGYSKPPFRLLCMVDNEKNMERRINMIKLGEFFKRRKWVIAVSGLLVIVITATLFLTVGAKKTAPYGNNIQPRQSKIYVLENASDREIMERMSAVWLFENGTARLSTSMISSYAMVGTYYYAIENDELLIFQEKDSPIAIFAVRDDHTIEFKSATVPLFADAGARYVYSPFAGTISIVVQMGNDKESLFNLFNYEPKSSYECLFGPHSRFDNIDSLNAALAEYDQDSITMVYVKHTNEFTKNEMLKITDKIVIPSKNFSMSTGAIDDWKNIPSPSQSGIAEIQEYGGVSDDALEVIYEDEYFRYSLSSIRSGKIMVVFLDGTKLTLKETLAQNRSSIKELLAAGVQVYIEPRDNPLHVSFYNHLHTYSINGKSFEPSHIFLFSAYEAEPFVSYFNVDELSNALDELGYKDKADRIRSMSVPLGFYDTIGNQDYIKDSKLATLGLSVKIGWAYSSHTPVDFTFTEK